MRTLSAQINLSIRCAWYAHGYLNVRTVRILMLLEGKYSAEGNIIQSATVHGEKTILSRNGGQDLLTGYLRETKPAHAT